MKEFRTQGEKILDDLCQIHPPNAGNYIWSFGESEADEDDGIAFVFGLHGDELAPLLALKVILRDIARVQNFLKKKVVLIIGNPEAVKQEKRGVECDGNRVYGQNGDSVEHQRARVVEDVLKNAGIKLLIDNHCTINPSEPFVFVPKAYGNNDSVLIKKALHCYDLDRVIYAHWENYTNSPHEIDHWIVDQSNGEINAITIEAGWMNDFPGPVELLISGTKNLLTSLGVYDFGESDSETPENLWEWDVVGEIKAENGFQWSEDINVKNFGIIKKGQIYAYRNGSPLIAKKDFALMFVKKNGEFDATQQQRVALILEPQM